MENISEKTQSSDIQEFIKKKMQLEKQLKENIPEPGFDGGTALTINTTVPAEAEGSTSTIDISKQINKTKFVQNAISLSLPSMIGYVQQLDGPAGYIFGLKQRQDTAVTGTDPLDQIVTRKSIQTEIREVKMEMTDEVIQDVENLFGSDFEKNFYDYQQSGGEVWNGPNKEIAKFFLDIGMQRMSNKINTDFVNWLSTVATIKGTSNIATYSDMSQIFGIIGELREALYKNTGKSGKVWILVTPKIAAFLSSTIGSTMNNGSDVYNKGRTIPDNKINGYVLTMGDIDVYQYDFYKNTPPVTGGTVADSELTGQIYMGFSGGAGVSSVFYIPYKEYVVHGGGDFYSGQSAVFYRVRDAWETNPLDTYNNTQTGVEMGGTGPKGTIDITKTNTSQYIVKSDITFGFKLIN